MGRLTCRGGRTVVCLLRNDRRVGASLVVLVVDTTPLGPLGSAVSTNRRTRSLRSPHIVMLSFDESAGTRCQNTFSQTELMMSCAAHQQVTANTECQRITF